MSVSITSFVNAMVSTMRSSHDRMDNRSRTVAFTSAATTCLRHCSWLKVCLAAVKQRSLIPDLFECYRQYLWRTPRLYRSHGSSKPWLRPQPHIFLNLHTAISPNDRVHQLPPSSILPAQHPKVYPRLNSNQCGLRKILMMLK